MQHVRKCRLTHMNVRNSVLCKYARARASKVEHTFRTVNGAGKNGGKVKPKRACHPCHAIFNTNLNLTQCVAISKSYFCSFQELFCHFLGIFLTLVFEILKSRGQSVKYRYFE